jgi:hypothetical protein
MAKMRFSDFHVFQHYVSLKISFIPKWYQVHLGDKHFENDNIEVVPIESFVRALGLA